MDRFILFFCRSLNELAVLSVDCGFVLFPPQHACFSLTKTILLYYILYTSTHILQGYGPTKIGCSDFLNDIYFDKNIGKI